MNEIEAVGASALSAVPAPPGAAGQERPWVFSFLIAPSAVVSNGVTAGVLALLLRQHGVAPARQAEILSLLGLPQMIYFLWSPITDFWMRRRSWLLLGAVAAALLTVIAFRQARLDAPLTVMLFFLAICCTQLVVSSCGGMLGNLHAESTRRRASSFYQSGSLAFGAGAIFVLAMLANRVGTGTLALTTGLLIAVPALAAFAAPQQQMVSLGDLRQTLTGIWREFKATFLNWRAVPYALVMVFPMGSGAAMGLLPGIAVDYGVTAQQVAWMNGLAGALLAAAGAMAASLIPARLRASVVYLVLGIGTGLPLLLLAFGPLRPANYFAGATLYIFLVGATYALFTAVVLEFLGTSGKSGSSRYSIINSLGNVPVAYMTFLDGRGAAHWGTRGLPATEAILGAIGGSLLLTYFLLHKPTEPSA
ncbi:MAG: hypothetical protein KGK08_12095 [Acidobacteriota bacterium]|nr:hypothetical protein [Acidobacteriota bacterium]